MQNAHNDYRHRLNPLQRGFTLVEIMVAMAISLFLIAGVFKLFIANKQSYRIQNNMSRLQEDGRFAVNQMGSILRMTGYKANSTDTTTFATGALTGTDATTAGAPDTLSVSFQAAADGTTVDCLGKKFPATNPPTMITNQFYIAPDANGVSSLYCSRTTVPAAAPALVKQALVGDVTNMQITYGVDADNNGAVNFYVTANKVTDWSKVVSIHISLLLVTEEDNVATSAQTYHYNGATVTAGDKRLHQVFSLTIALRNRLV